MIADSRSSSVPAVADLALPFAVIELCSARAMGEPVAATDLAGGVINRTRRIRTSSGASLVVKECRGAPPDFFRAERVGLDALRVSDGWRVPEVLHADHECLVLEDLGEGHPRSDDYWDDLARAWAGLHVRRASRFGYAADNYYGLVRQDNRWREDGYDFYAEARFLHVLRLPVCSRLLEPLDKRRLERIAVRLRDLVPPQGPSLLHGDLWCGNLLVDDRGGPAVVDPSVHFGWPESDLHNAVVFGGFDERFFSAYRECRYLEPGWRERLDLLSLPHLLGMIEHRCELAEVVPWVRRLLQRFA